MNAKVFLCVLNVTLLFAGELDLYRRKTGFTIQHPYLMTTGNSAVSCVAACNIDGNCKLAAYYFVKKQCSLGNDYSFGVLVPSGNSVVYSKGPCKFGWTDVGGRCLLFESIMTTWQGCKAHCRSLNGNLAHIYSPEDLELVEAQIPCVWGTDGCSPWLGINDIDNEGQLLGAAGQSVTADVARLLKKNNDGDDCSYFDTLNRAFLLFPCSYKDSCFCEIGYLV